MSDEAFIQDGSILPIIHPKAGEIPSVKAAGLPIKFSLSEAGFDTPAPMLGQDNESIYKELGLGEADLSRLKEAKVI